MNTQRFKVCVSAVVVLCLVAQARAEDDDAPFVRRTFGYFPVTSTLGPDYFLSDKSIAVVAGAEDPADQTASPVHFAPCLEKNGDLADTTWVIRRARHVTQGNHSRPEVFIWLLTDETPEPPPEGVMTLTGDGSPLILSQEVVFYRTWSFSFDCPDGQSGDLVVGSVGSPIIIVTALFNR